MEPRTRLAAAPSRRAAVSLYLAAIGPSDAADPGRRRDLVRRLAAAELGVAPGRLSLGFDCPDCRRGNDGTHGRPILVLDGKPAGLNVSYSRSGRWLLAGFSRHGLGVDVAATGSAAFGDTGNIDAVMLTAGERALLAVVSDRRLFRARLWTRKEAALKATGDGLRLDPATVGVAGRSGAAKLRQWPDAAGKRPRMALADVDLAGVDQAGVDQAHAGTAEAAPGNVAPDMSDLVAAVAVLGRRPRVTLRGTSVVVP